MELLNFCAQSNGNVLTFNKIFKPSFLEKYANYKDLDNNNALIYLISNNFTAETYFICKELIRYKCDIFIKDILGQSILEILFHMNKTHTCCMLVELFFEHGYVESNDESLISALLMTNHTMYVSYLLNLLIKYRCKLHFFDGHIIWHDIVYNQHALELLTILQPNININEQNNYGNRIGTIFLYKQTSNIVSIYKCLITMGYSTTMANHKQNTDLMILMKNQKMCCWEMIKMVDLMTNAGCDINAINGKENKCSAFLFESKHPSTYVIYEHLIKKGLIPNPVEFKRISDPHIKKLVVALYRKWINTKCKK